MHFSGTYKTVTLMRDPLERTISNYRMAVRAGVIKDDVDAWLDSPVAESMARVYLRYLCGKTVIEAANLERMESLGLANLAKIDLVGSLEDLGDFAANFKAMFGASPTIPRYNIGNGAQLVLSKTQHKKLRKLLEPDERLYAEALTSSVDRSNATADGSARSERWQEA